MPRKIRVEACGEGIQLKIPMPDPSPGTTRDFFFAHDNRHSAVPTSVLADELRQALEMIAPGRIEGPGSHIGQVETSPVGVADEPRPAPPAGIAGGIMRDIRRMAGLDPETGIRVPGDIDAGNSKPIKYLEYLEAKACGELTEATKQYIRDYVDSAIWVLKGRPANTSLAEVSVNADRFAAGEWTHGLKNVVWYRREPVGI